MPACACRRAEDLFGKVLELPCFSDEEVQVMRSAVCSALGVDLGSALQCSESRADPA